MPFLGAEGRRQWRKKRRESVSGENAGSGTDGLTVPAHVAMILDGNGRWAKKRGLPRQMGHKKGCETLEEMIEICAEMGFRYLTVYAFSTENWRRPQDEVGALMQLFRYYAKRLLKRAKKSKRPGKNDRGKKRFFSGSDRGHRSFGAGDERQYGDDVYFAVNYGARDEITRAVRHMAEDCKAGTLKPEEITEGLRVLLSGYGRDSGSGSFDPDQR